MRKLNCQIPKLIDSNLNKALTYILYHVIVSRMQECNNLFPYDDVIADENVVYQTNFDHNV